MPADISFLPVGISKLPPLMIFEKTSVYPAILMKFEGVTRIEEQHIMQNTTARKRYPEFEKLLEFDLDLTSLKESSWLSLVPAFRLKGRGLLMEVLERLSPSSRIFLALF